MKKALTVLLSVLLLVTCLAGCGGAASSSQTGSQTAAESSEPAGEASGSASTAGEGENIDITFFTTQVGTDPQFLDIISKFEEANPGIKVELIPGGDDQLQKLMSLYAANEAPTVSLLDPINIWENKERMLALDPAQLPWMEQCYTGFDMYTFDDQIYGMPISIQGYGILYNTRVIEEAIGGDFDPDTIKTRDDLRSLFETIQASGTAASMFTGVNWSLGAHFLGLVFAGYRGGLADQQALIDQLKSGEYDLKSDEVWNGLMDTFDLIAEFNYNKEDPLVANLEMDAQAFATGQAATWFQGDWSWVQIQAVEGRDTEFGILPVPLSNDDDDRFNTLIPASAPKGYCVDVSQNDEAHQEAGLKFVEFITLDSYAQEVITNALGANLPYSNATAVSESPLAAATKTYMEQDRTLNIEAVNLLLPSDFWYENGATMEQYLAGGIDRDTAADMIMDYWKNQA